MTGSDQDSKLSDLTNQKPFMLSVSKTDSINIILYTLPALYPCCVPWLNLQVRQSIKSLYMSCLHTLCARFSCLHSRVRQQPTSANLRWVFFAILAWFASHFQEEQPVCGTWKTPNKVCEGKASSKTSLVIPGVFELEGTLIVFTLGLSLIYFHMVLFGWKNLWYFTFEGGPEQHKPETSEGIVSTFKEVWPEPIEDSVQAVKESVYIFVASSETVIMGNSHGAFGTTVFTHPSIHHLHLTYLQSCHCV